MVHLVSPWVPTLTGPPMRWGAAHPLPCPSRGAPGGVRSQIPQGGGLLGKKEHVGPPSALGRPVGGVREVPASSAGAHVPSRCSAPPARTAPHTSGACGLGVQRKAGASACPPLGPSLGREAPLGGQDASANAPPAPPWAGRGSAHTQACRLLLASASRSGSVFTARRERLRQRRPAHAAGALPAPHTGFPFCRTCILVIPSGVF